jgi:NADH-quinone oxidoreductase subunit M
VDGVPWLTVVTFAPLAGAVVLALIPGRALIVHQMWSLLVTVSTFGLSLGMWAAFDGSAAGFQLVDRATWVGPLNFQ